MTTPDEARKLANEFDPMNFDARRMNDALRSLTDQIETLSHWIDTYGKPAIKELDSEKALRKFAEKEVAEARTEIERLKVGCAHDEGFWFAAHTKKAKQLEEMKTERNAAVAQVKDLLQDQLSALLNKNLTQAEVERLQSRNRSLCETQDELREELEVAIELAGIEYAIHYVNVRDLDDGKETVRARIAARLAEKRGNK